MVDYSVDQWRKGSLDCNVWQTVIGVSKENDFIDWKIKLFNGLLGYGSFSKVDFSPGFFFVYAH